MSKIRGYSSPEGRIITESDTSESFRVFTWDRQPVYDVVIVRNDNYNKVWHFPKNWDLA